MEHYRQFFGSIAYLHLHTVCVCGREREREKSGGFEREREMCVYMCVCVSPSNEFVLLKLLYQTSPLIQRFLCAFSDESPYLDLPESRVLKFTW